MKREVVIVSDLWGAKRSEWLVNFKALLEDQYEVKFYDACQLGGIDLTIYEQENLHRQFLDFGIEKAVSNLLKLESEPKVYLGCSISGVILWKAALIGLPIERLIAISSTRLRKETERPNCPLSLFFGENDPYQPEQNWFNQMGIKGHFIPKGDHDIYKNHSTVFDILTQSILK